MSISEEGSKKKKRKKIVSKIVTVVLAVFLVVGLGIMFYPSVSDWWNSWHASRSISEYVAAVEQVDNSELERMLSEAEVYNKQLASNQNDVLHGLSGDISLGHNGLIESTPMWVELGSVR